jgi:hypothetical protein
LAEILGQRESGKREKKKKDKTPGLDEGKKT